MQISANSNLGRKDARRDTVRPMVGIERRSTNADDVRVLLQRQYAEPERSAVWALLTAASRIGEMNGWYAERVQLAALALSKGNASLIGQWIDLGNTDARDLQLAVEGQLGAA